MSTLTVKDFSIRTKKDDRPIVTNLSFSLSSGESLVLLGQSGCGKTMTCRDGMVVEQGKTGDVYTAPKTEYAKALVKASALSKGEGRADC